MIAATEGGIKRSDALIKILLLGPPEIYHGDQPVLIKRRLNRALLFYLAASLYPVSREQICDLFWPDEDEENARKNLREALSRIRTGVGVNQLIVSDGEQVSLNPAIVWVDYREMHHQITPLLSSSEMNSSSVLPEWMVSQMRRGMSLCRTYRFMQGVSIKGSVGFDNWLDLNNQAYSFTVLKTCDRLIDHYISSGNLEEALIWLGKVNEIVPLDEHFNYLALICLRDTGKFQELIVFSNYLERLYGQQQETFPPRFKEIQQEALRTRSFHGVTDTGWPDEERGEPVFVGRGEELGKLNRLLHARGSVLIKGEAGIGKTRLIKHFYLQQPFRPRLLYCRSHPLGTRVAFQSIMQPLRNQIKDEEWQRLDPQDQERLSVFYHQILQGMEAPSFPVPEEGWLPVLEDIFQSFMRLMENLATRRPLLFVIDDAMHMDLASISLVSFLVDNGFFDRYGLLVFMTSPEIENRALSQFIQRIRRSRKLETIDLPPFSLDTIREFITGALGRVPEDAIVTEIQRLSGGNPYFLAECVRAAQWTLSGDRVVASLDSCNPPDGILALVQDKVNGLEPESVATLKAAAILGRDFPSEVVQAMTGLDEERLARGMDELIQEGFVAVNPDIKPLGGYHFLHDVEREVIVKRMNPTERQALHRKAGAALVMRSKGFPEIASSLAVHYEASLQPIKAVEAWLEAGRYARSQYQRDNTYQAYGRALELINIAPRLYKEDLILQLVNEWGNYAHDRDDQETGWQIYQTCLEIGNQKQSLGLIGAAHSGLGRVADFVYDYQKAAESFQRAIFYLSDTEYTAERIKALSRLGIMYFGMDEYSRSLALLEEARRLNPQEKDADSLENQVNILSYLCFLHIFMGNPQKASEFAGEMARISILVSRKSARVQAHALLGMAQYFNGDVSGALLTCRDVRELAESLQVRFWLSLLDLVEGMAYLYVGDLDRAWWRVDQAHKREMGFPLEKLFTQSIKVKGDIFRLAGEHKKAREFYSEISENVTRSYQAIEAKYWQGIILAEDGEMDAARKTIAGAYEEARLRGLKGIELGARMSLLRMTSPLKMEVSFEEVAQSILEQMAERGLREGDIYALLLPALDAEMKGNNEESFTKYKQVREYLQQTGFVWLEFWVLRQMLSLTRDTAIDTRIELERVNSILTKLSETATHPAIKGSYIKFRNKWRGYVNDMSTKRVYKNKHT